MRRWRRSSDVLSRLTPRGVVLLHVDQGEPFLLSGSGAALWELLAAPIGPEEAIGVLAAQHDVEPAVVAMSVEPIVAELIQRGVVEEVT